MKIGIIGMGYVGQELAKAMQDNELHFSIEYYDPFIDARLCIGALPIIAIRRESIQELRDCEYIFICLPTLLNEDKTPNYSAFDDIFREISTILTGKTIIIESSVGPGTTEKYKDYLENQTRFTCGEDFYMGFSPERINPGDKLNTFQNTPKIVAGCGRVSYLKISNLYCFLCDKVVKADTTQEAEAAKLIENCQRDVNIAFMNECVMTLGLDRIDHNKVFKLCRTKWNWLNFKPGLVGGQCIPVNPYYLWASGFSEYEEPSTDILTMARRVNEWMPNHIVRVIHSLMNESFKGKDILIMGVTYKDNADSCKGSRLFDLQSELIKWGTKVDIWEPKGRWRQMESGKCDVVIIGTASKWVQEFIEDKGLCDLYKKDLPDNKRVLIDLPGIVNDYPLDYKYWRLK